jgi:transcriptional regulator NrdR family protein
MKHVIKQAGHTEAFDENKLYSSIYATCLAVNEPLASAKVTAKKVTADVKKWLEPKSEVTVHDIRAYAGKKLGEIDHHAAYLYLHHRIMW